MINLIETNQHSSVEFSESTSNLDGTREQETKVIKVWDVPTQLIPKNPTAEESVKNTTTFLGKKT